MYDTHTTSSSSCSNSRSGTLVQCNLSPPPPKLLSSQSMNAFNLTCGTGLICSDPQIKKKKSSKEKQAWCCFLQVVQLSPQSAPLLRERKSSQNTLHKTANNTAVRQSTLSNMILMFLTIFQFFGITEPWSHDTAHPLYL